MVKKPAEVIEENEEEGSGRKPDFLIRVRQPVGPAVDTGATASFH